MSATIFIGAVCLFIAIACAIFLSRRHAVGRGANNIPGPQEPASNAFLGRSKTEGVAESSEIPQDAKQTIEGQRKDEQPLAPIKIASGAEALAVPHATEETIEHQQLDQELIAPVKIASTTEIPAAVDDVQERIEHHGARVDAPAAIAQSATEILAEVQAAPPDTVALTDLKSVGTSPASDLDSPPLESQQTPESDGSSRSSVEPETPFETSNQHVDDDEAREVVPVEAGIDSSCPKSRQDRKQGDKKQRERAPASTQTAESTSKSLFDPNAQPAGVRGGQAAAPAAIGNKQTEEIETAKSPVESTLAQQPPRRDPGRYRPRIGTTVKSASPKRSRKTAKAPTERTLSIKVRVLFERDGSCHVSLLPEKSASLPDNVEVSGTLGALRLIILQEDFTKM